MTRVVVIVVCSLGLLACAGTKKEVDTAHEEFKREVRPVAKVVDEKTREVVEEGKKGLSKVSEALSSSEDQEGGVEDDDRGDEDGDGGDEDDGQ